MKKLFVISLIVLLFSPLVANNPVVISVNEGVELMSIMARLADYREYNSQNCAFYIKDIEDWFSDYNNHESIDFMRRIRATNGISYDAVATMSISLDMSGKKIKLLPIDTTKIDRRWKGIDMDSILFYINKFSKDTKFKKFFKNHKEAYDSVITKWQSEVEEVFDYAWYSDFYGKDMKGKYHVVIAMSNGNNHYGPKLKIGDNIEEPYAILGYACGENNEIPPFYWYKGLVLHEFNHSFANSVVLNYDTMVWNAICDKIFKLTFGSMRLQAYGNGGTILDESLVRAVSIIYMMDHNEDIERIENTIFYEVSLNYFWMPELINSLKYYMANRDKYPDLQSFAPKLIEFIDPIIDMQMERVNGCFK